MVPKKSIFERMGLIEPKNDQDITEYESNSELEYDAIPEPEHIPDLSDLMNHDVKHPESENNEMKVTVDSLEHSTYEEPKQAISAETVKFETVNPEKFSEQKMDQNISDKLDLIIGAYEKNKMMTIDEIYRNAHLDNDVKKTIFMADVYLKAVPENLPIDIKRETVLNIMNISNISLDELLNDAYRRIDSLNTVLEETVATTQDVFNRNDATIRELEKRIEDLKEINKNRKKFQEDQNTMIEYEIQKIINLVEFVKPKK